MGADCVAVLDCGCEARGYDGPTDGRVLCAPLQRVRVYTMLIRVGCAKELKKKVSVGKMNRIFSDGVKIVASERAGIWISFDSRKDKAHLK